MNLPNVKWPKVVLFGDSITQLCFEPRDGLWGALLADKLQRICDVVNRGFGGYNTRHCKVVLPHIFSAKDVSETKAFVIFLGANDTAGQQVSLTEYSENLKSIISYLDSIGLCKENIILMTPPPYCDKKFAVYCLENGFEKPQQKDNEIVAQYAKECCKVGQMCGVDTVDVFSNMLKNKDWESYLIDGLHLSGAGSNMLFNLLWPNIEKRIDMNEIKMPQWNDQWMVEIMK